LHGDPALDAIEAQLAAQPVIQVPCIALQGADDGVDPPAAEDDDHLPFKRRYERKVIAGAGHNLPQEKPEAFASTILSLATPEWIQAVAGFTKSAIASVSVGWIWDGQLSDGRAQALDIRCLAQPQLSNGPA
jgi:hypothetical protein